MAHPTQPEVATGLPRFDRILQEVVANYGQIAAPLTRLTKKNAFCWGEVLTEAFDRLKHAMTTVPVLALPNLQI